MSEVPPYNLCRLGGRVGHPASALNICGARAGGLVSMNHDPFNIKHDS